MVGFTAMSEQMDIEDVANLINNWFKLLVDMINKYKRTIDKFIIVTENTYKRTRDIFDFRGDKTWLNK